MKKIKVERFNKDMAPFFKMAPQQFEEQVLKFEQETNDFINEGTNESSQRSIQKSRGHPLGDHGFPEENTQGRSPCMNALLFFSMLVLVFTT